MNWIFTPPDDVNLVGYKSLVIGAQSGRYDVMYQRASATYSSATEESLRTCANLLERSAKLALDMNVRTFEEAGSFSGFVKGFITGFLNPLKGVESAILLAEVWWKSDSFQKIDAIYLTAWRKQETSHSVSNWVSLATGAAVLCFAGMKRSQKA